MKVLEVDTGLKTNCEPQKHETDSTQAIWEDGVYTNNARTSVNGQAEKRLLPPQKLGRQMCTEAPKE